MNFRLLALLAAAVVVLAGAAYYFGQERKALRSESYQGGPLIAGLETRINDADSLRLESQEGGVVTLERTDGAWRMTSHHGYRAHQERVTGLLKQIATLTTVEPKTSKPENHKRLNLDDPADELSLATRITVKAGEATIADLVAGLNRPELQGGGAFVRLWDEDQTWLVEGEFKPRRRALDLLDRNIVNIDGRRVRSARIQHPAGEAGGDAAPEATTVAKNAPDQADYSLGAAIPDGMRPKSAQELSTVARLGDFLIFEEVRPASEVTLDRPVVGAFETFDGLRYTLSAQAQDDGNVWVTVDAGVGERSDGLDAFVEANKGQDSEAGRIADQFQTAEAVAEEAAAIERHTDGWAYKLTDYKTKRLTTTAADLLEPVKEAEAEAADKKAQ